MDYIVENMNTYVGIDPEVKLEQVGLSMDQLDSNPRYQVSAGCDGCLSDNTNATAQRPSCCLSCR